MDFLQRAPASNAVALDVPPAYLLAVAALLPLASIATVKFLDFLGFVVPLKRNVFRSPTDGLDPVPHVHSGRRGWKLWALAFLAFAQAAAWAGLSVNLGVHLGDASWKWPVGMGLVALGWVYAALAPIVRPTDTAPLLLFAIYVEHSILSILRFVTILVHGTSATGWTLSSLALAANALLVAICVTFPLEPPLSEAELAERDALAKESARQACPAEGEEMGTQPLMPTPERTTSLGGWLIFAWVAPMMALAAKRKLQYPDVWILPKQSQAAGVHRASLRLNEKTLLGRIFWSNSQDTILAILLVGLSSSLSFAAPFCLNRILKSLTPPPPGQPADPNERTSAFIYAFVMFAATYVKAQVELQEIWCNLRGASRTRSLVMMEVYVKSLKRRDLSGAIEVKAEDEAEPKKDKDGKPIVKKEAGASNGKIQQLMAQDSMKISQGADAIAMISQVPIELFLCVFALYKLLGWTCFVGLLFAVITTPAQTWVMKRRVRLQKAILEARDIRTEKLTELINSIRFVKYSASEPSWLNRVFGKRENELKAMMRSRLNGTLLQMIWQLTPGFTMLMALGASSLIGKRQFDVSTLFTSVALFQLLENPMSMLPWAWSQLLEAKVSLDRVEAFLAEDEVAPWVSAFTEGAQTNEVSPRVAIVDGSFRYDKADADADGEPTSAGAAKLKVVVDEPLIEPLTEPTAETPLLSDTTEVLTPSEAEELEKFELRDVSVEFPLGQLSLVCGPTGAGKTSLLMALLGEMIPTKGEVHLPKGTHTVDSNGMYDGVAYAAQLPWLQQASIRDNITFGAPFEQARYDAVVEACALPSDFKQFEAGDQTEIGEKGISLSGGQKARVALARAVYSRAKTVLLDDPLSAVDSHTAKHLFKKCLKGPLLKGRTIILITHHVALCFKGAAYLVQMRNGTVTLQGYTDKIDKSLISEEGLDGADEEEAVEALVETEAVKKAIDEETPAAIEAAGAETVVVPGTGASTPGGKLITVETNKVGRVASSVYLTYMRAVGWDTWVYLLTMMIVDRMLRISERIYFSYWGASYRIEKLPQFGVMSAHAQTIFAAARSSEFRVQHVAIPWLSHIPIPHINMPSASDNVVPWLLVYMLILFISTAAFVTTILLGFRGSFRASRVLFSGALTRISRAPFRYWDTTPTGRVVNRFASDFETIDTSLTEQIRHCLDLFLNFVTNLIVIAVISPMFIPPAIFIVGIYIRLAMIFVRASRDLRRLSSNARSPIYSQFGELLAGVVTVRAFGAERQFLDNLYKAINKFQGANYASMVSNRYLSWRFDILGATAILITTLLALLSGASPGKAAVAITSAQALIQAIYWLCRILSMLETDLNAVERVAELLETPQEAPAVIEGQRPPAAWPTDKGSLVVEDLVISYAEGLPAVIKGTTFTVGPKEKVGLVGRTGSGKSTMALSLLRITDPVSGRIMLDGVDITKIGLSDLRSRLTLIPQEAVLFSGTVRSNLDPFGEHTDAACLDALARVHLNNPDGRTPGPSTFNSRAPSRVASKTDLAALDTASNSGASETTKVPIDTGRLAVTLDGNVSPGGLNFSAGQRQLLAMARALLRRSNVIIMDEATASVDMETDAKIQQTIAEEFESSMVLCIAHRLKTVISMDKILVLDKGLVLEYDSPKNLLKNKEGSFYKMCEASSEWEELKQIAGLV